MKIKTLVDKLSAVLLSSLLLILGCNTTFAQTQEELPQIPRLNWQPRSDWVNVKTLGAVGDGVADDTTAIQSACTSSTTGSTIYFPPGTYRITQTLNFTGIKRLAVTLIGHGRDSRIVWSGTTGGTMFRIDSMYYARYIGLEIDGASIAAKGMDHETSLQYETELRHQSMAFKNFTTGGIWSSGTCKYATAETTVENCLFENCYTGITIAGLNYYDWTITGCEFRNNYRGVYNYRGNFYMRDCHYEGSTDYDIYSIGPEHGCSVRRCTSYGSYSFIYSNSPICTLPIQDCQVSNWTRAAHAIYGYSRPICAFDNSFTNPPNANKPMVWNTQLGLIVDSNNYPSTLGLTASSSSSMYYVVPTGTNGGGSLNSARQRFLKSEVEIPTKVFDAKTQYGAVGNGITDDTTAIQNTINAARNYGQGAIAYLPKGTYKITSTLQVYGQNYYVGGCGWSSALAWGGTSGGTMMSIVSPQKLVLENITVGNNGGTNGIEVLQTGTGGPSSIHYEGVFVYGKYVYYPTTKGIVLQGLGQGETVTMSSVMGNIQVKECAAADILLNTTYEGAITVSGTGTNRSGFFGIQSRLSTAASYGLYLMDNQNAVASDFYMEQAQLCYKLSGSSANPVGRATLSSPKANTVLTDTTGAYPFLDINDYSGDVGAAFTQFYTSQPMIFCKQQGTRPVAISFLANNNAETYVDRTLLGVSSTVYAIANYVVCPNYIPGPNKIPDNYTSLSMFNTQLDDFRVLGDVDLELNFGWVSGTGRGCGLIGNYYNGTAFNTYLGDLLSAGIDHLWGLNSPGVVGSGTDNWSARWIGQVQSIEEGQYVFSLTADDGVRLWVNNQLLIDRWTTGSATNTGTTTLGPGQKYTIKLEYFDSTGTANCTLKWIRPGQSTAVAIPKTQLYYPASSLFGLTGQYYNGTTFNTFVGNRIDAIINYSWGTAAPMPGVTGSNCSVRWVGQIQSQEAGTYTFTATGDDTISVWINDVLVTSGTGIVTGTATLAANTKYPIKMEACNASGSATAILKWLRPGQVDSVVVPFNKFYR